MSKLFHVDVVTPEAIIWSGAAQSISARTTEGDIGILADHEATMAALATGPVELVLIASSFVIPASIAACTASRRSS